MAMKTINRLLACTPFETRDAKVQVRGGLPVIAQKQELTALKVVFDSDDEKYHFPKGITVYVRGEACKHQYAREVYEQGEEKFILVPFEHVVGWEQVP